MTVKEIGDPRLQALFGIGEPKDIGVRPVVRLPKTGPSGKVLAVSAAIAAVALFWILESRRDFPAEPSVRARAADAPLTAAEPPPLYIPPVLAPPAAPLVTYGVAPALQFQPAPAASQFSQPQAAAPPISYLPQPVPGMSSLQPPPPPRSAAGPALVVDTTGSAAPATGNQEAATGAEGAAHSPFGRQSGGRMRASALANRSNTVAQGVLIPAVLETAFDSTRPGFARAIVSRDVRGFDGTKVLIPRGSRLIGDYRSEVAPGQNRALITWTRLIRPDGVTIAMDSPAVDKLGRGGIRASVNTHFFERFAGALLQSTIDVGRTVAGRAATGTVVIVPGSAANEASSLVSSSSIGPTLKVRAGKSISVFVAHDLDFGTAEANR